MTKSNLLSLAEQYDEKYNIVARLDILKLAYIRKTPEGKWRVMSETGKNLGTYTSKDKAEARLKQVEFFKHIKKKKASASNSIDLTHLKNLSYSAVMRELRKQSDVDTVKEFLCIFKEIFDKLVLSGDKEPADKAMPAALILFSKKHNVECTND